MMKRFAFAPKIIILGMTLLAFFLRVYKLDAQSYWIDEAWTIFYANLSLAELWHNLQTIRAAPPLYHLLTIYWVDVLGDGEYSLRFLSLVFSVVAVPLTYRLGKTLGGDRLGLLAAGLLAVAPYQLWHAQDARNYSLLTATTAASMWSFLNLWQRGNWRWWLLYGISTEAAIMSHYHGLVIIGVQGLFFLFTWRRHWRYYLPWAASLGVILLPLGLWLTLGSTLWQSDHWLPFVGLWDSYWRSATAYSIGELTPPPLAIYLTAGFVIFYGLGLLYAASRPWPASGWRGSEMLAFLATYTLAPNLAVWLYSRLQTSVYLERYLIPVQVGYLLAVSLGILAVGDGLAAMIRRRSAGWQRRVRWAGYLSSLGLLVGISSWVLAQHYSDNAYAKPGWRQIVQTIETLGLPGDAILMTGDGGEKLFDYYYDGNLPVHYDFNTPAPPPEAARQRLAEITAGHQRLWYTPYGVEIDPVLEDWLAENAYPAWHSWVGRKRLALYHLHPNPDRRERLETPVAKGLKLIEARLPGAATTAGNLLPVALTWQTEGPLPGNYQLSLRLINSFGDVFAQSDWPPLANGRQTATWPPNQPITDRRSLWIPPDVPPGNYLLQLVLYEPTTGQPLGQPVTLPHIAIGAAQITPPLETLSIPNFSPSDRRHSTTAANLQLAGYAFPKEIQPGQEMWLWLYWQAQAAPIPNATLQISLHSNGETIRSNFPLAESVGPLDSWQAGQVRRAVYHLPTTPRLQGNQAEIRLALHAAGQEGPVEFTLGEVRLLNRERQFDPPEFTNRLDALFGEPVRLTLLGYDLNSRTSSAGEALSVTLHWQAEKEMATNYTVFVQLLNEASEVVAQVDAQPQAGAAPTTTWLPGELVTDRYSLSLPPDTPPGAYRLIAGMYDAASGQRLPVAPGNDFVELGQITVQ